MASWSGAVPATRKMKGDTRFRLRQVKLDQNQVLSDLSNIVVVTVKTVSWWDRAVAYGKDLQVSGPLSAFFVALGGIIGIVLQRKRVARRTRT
jgi:hypothetical protein